MQSLVDQGVLEITLLGQNVNAYGVSFSSDERLREHPDAWTDIERDRGAFAKLLRACGDIEGLYALLADVTPQVERFLSANGTDDAARARARQGLAAQAAAQYRLLADFAKLDR
ncbi:MAG: (Dimethylallyl)adenosine tRNA methylthiotransferase MiaB [bacterium ADurb.Bin429]|nr:MAG: (Dimethylallyl)adenosine tRNA methylthiotransferase MiaB [bacterium ADurb.Bin429]